MNTLPTNLTSTRLNKVPEVRLSFWIIKITSTTVGEIGADFQAINSGFGQGGAVSLQIYILNLSKYFKSLINA